MQVFNGSWDEKLHDNNDGNLAIKGYWNPYWSSAGGEFNSHTRINETTHSRTCVYNLSHCSSEVSFEEKNKKEKKKIPRNKETSIIVVECNGITFILNELFCYEERNNATMNIWMKFANTPLHTTCASSISDEYPWPCVYACMYIPVWNRST